MQLDRYELSPAGRQHVTGVIERQGTGSGLHPVLGFFFGCPFLAVGAWLVLVGTRTIQADPAKVHAPLWVLAAAGFSFFAGGLFVWGVAGVELGSRAKRKRLTREHRGEPAFSDYPWDPQKFQVSDGKDAAKAFCLAIILTIFISMFNWWAFAAKGPWMLKAIVVVFDLAILFVWWQAARQLGRAVKFGRSHVVFEQFPFRPGGTVVLRWQPDRGISQVQKGSFTLRCIEQWVEVEKTRKRTQSTVKQDFLWSAAWILDTPRNFLLGDSVGLAYDLPAHAPSTCLRQQRAVFWQLVVRLELPGLDFCKTYLVPVYAFEPASNRIEIH